jgi:hypothetical protein
MKLSNCGRFVVLEALHLDREVLGLLAAWAEARGIGLQDAIQLAVVGFVDIVQPSDTAPAPTLTVQPALQPSRAPAHNAWTDGDSA